MTKIKADEEQLANSSNDAERNNLQNKINEAKGQVAEEVNVVLGAEISAFPKLTAQIEMRNINI
jgi:hypothetical protein